MRSGILDGKPIAAGDGISDITPVRGNLAFRYPVIPGTYINETGSAYANTTESTSNVAGEKGGNALVGGTTVAEAGSGETASYTPPANPIKKSEIQNTGSDTPPAIHNSYTRPSGGAPARKSNQVAIRTDEAAPTTVEHIPFGSAAYSAGSKSKGGTAGGGNGSSSDQ